MGKQEPAADKEHFVRDCLWDRYLPRNGSERNRKGSNSTDRLTRENADYEVVDQFINRFFCIQIKHGVPMKLLMDAIEKEILIRVLSRFNGHKTDASRFLGIKNTTLHEKMKKHKIRIVKKVQ